MAHALGELNPVQVRELLGAQHVGRITCQVNGRARMVTVVYHVDEQGHVDVLTPECEGMGVAQEPLALRFEVDRVEGPSRWSTIVGWGFLEPAAETRGQATYRIRFTGMRGFYRGARPALAS